MFEKLAGKLLSRLLSKYFLSPENGSNGQHSSSPKKKKPSSSSTQLGVWSGYVSLENLELRSEVVNDILRSKGLPLEVVHCTLGRVEITVPWAKLGSKSSSSSRRSSSLDAGLTEENATVVVVIDGIHALVRTKYEFDDEALRQAAINERRQKLQESLSSDKNDESKSGSAFSGLAGFFHKRFAEGIVNDVFENLQVHIRDLHIRLEDVMSNPSNPFACGITLESLHVQADDDIAATNPQDEGVMVVEGTYEDAIRKVAQLNHFTVYWNALDYGDGLPAEISVLQYMKESNPGALSQYLDRCIVRRSNAISSPSRAMSLQTTPTHSYVLRPVDGTCRVILSTNPRNLELRPAMVASINVADVSVEVRDFQCSQMAGFLSCVQEHNFAKQYRLYRPTVSVKENPRAWWEYSCRVIRMELRESNMRWSWKRFMQRFEQRRRYCELYERKMRYPATRPISRVSSKVSLDSYNRESLVSLADPMTSGHSSVHGSNIGAVYGFEGVKLEMASPDDGAGPSSQPRDSLTAEEEAELQELEDGVRGDLTVRDIVIFRALVDTRVAGIASNEPAGSTSKTSRFRRMISSFVGDDMRSEEEYARLISYLESATIEKELPVDRDKESLIAVSIQMHLEKGCVTFFSPLPSTANLNQHRRLHERFLDLTIRDMVFGYALLGNYKSSCLQASLRDFVGSEIRSNSREYVIISRPHTSRGVNPTGGRPALFIGGEQNQLVRSNSADGIDAIHLLVLEIKGKPIESPECNSCLYAQLDALEILLLPDCEWMRRLRLLLLAIPSSSGLSKNVDAFWDNLSMARINSSNSAVAELQAKADAALFNHKNIDVNVHVKCPIVRIGDGNGCDLIIDLGHAHFSTERLAGVATGQLSHSALSALKMKSDRFCEEGEQNVETEEDTRPAIRRWDSSDSASFIMTPVFDGSDMPEPQMKGLNNFFLGSSAMSVDSRNAIGRSTISLLPNDISRLSIIEHDDGQSQRRHRSTRNLLDSCFYDVFQLRLFFGTMAFSGDDENCHVDILKELAIRITFEKSVIPADHTLCRLKMHCMVDNISLSISETLLPHIVDMMKAWHQVLDGGSLHSESLASGRTEGRMTIRSELRSRGVQTLGDAVDASSDTSSALDENEFLDALENDDGDEAVGTWFYDPWKPGTESHGDGALSQSYRRRRPPSVSDVSSVSDRSQRRPRRRHSPYNYLSAENLARLDEDNSGSDSELLSDADSFHSAMSLGGHNELRNALEDDIKRTEDEVAALNEEIFHASESKAKTSIDMGEAKEKRQRRQVLKLERVRLEAELRALRAAHHDLLAQEATAQDLHYEEELEGGRPGSPHSPLLTGNGEMNRPTSATDAPVAAAATAHAKALLRAKRQRALPHHEEEGFEHNLTSGLNRELFRASFTITTVAVDLCDFQPAEEEKCVSEDAVDCQFCISQFSVSVLRRANDTQVSASIENVSAAGRRGTGVATHERFLFVGGAKPSVLDSLLPCQYPHHVASNSVEEPFLRIAIDVRRHAGKTSTSSCNTMKLRVLFGDMEVSPDSQLLPSLILFGERAKKVLHDEKSSLSSSHPPDVKSEKPFIVDTLCSALTSECSSSEGTIGSSRKPRSYIDFSLRLSSIRAKLLDDDRFVGALVLTETSARLGRAFTNSVYKCRTQLEIRCSNIQIFDVSRVDSANAREIFGRRDPYSPLFRVKMRIQLVPRTQLGGWVVERGFSKNDVDDVSLGDRIWNMHCGLKVQSVYIMASRQAIEGLSNPAKKLFQSLKSTSKDGTDKPYEHTIINETGARDSQDPTPCTNGSPQTRAIHAAAPIRWRVDASLSNFSAVCPSQVASEWTLPENVGNNAVVTFSLHSSIEESQQTRSALSGRLGITEVSVTRSSDDWPVLEPTAVFCDVTLKCKDLDRKVFPPPMQLKLSSDSVWSESENVFQQTIYDLDGEKNHLESSASDDDITLSVKVAPIRINLSAPICYLLIDTVKGLSHKGKRKDVTFGNDVPVSGRDQAQGGGISHSAKIQFRLQAFEAKLLREAANGSTISYADPLASLVVRRVVITSHRNSLIADATIEVGKVSLYDLTSLPGVRVLGREYGNDQDSEVFTPFAIMSMKLMEATDIGASTKLDLQLGRIQFILIPSILASVLEFQSCLKDHTDTTFQASSDGSKEAALRGQGGPLESIKLPFNVRDVLFSFCAAGFDCIISSRDIFSHIREKSQDPINVVAFRWKADLNGVFSLSDEAETNARGVLQMLTSNEGPPMQQVPLVEAPQFWPDFIGKHVQQGVLADGGAANMKDNPRESGPHLTRVVNSKFVLAVNDFQALRTCVTRLVRKVKGDGDVQMKPYCYAVTPPTAGEQRITNRIGFKITYRLAGTSLKVNQPEKDALGENGVHHQIATHSQVSHAFQLEVGLVDVLLYISQSTGGMNEAFRVTLKPMLEMLKRSDESERPTKVFGTDEALSRPDSTLKDLMKFATSVCCVQAEGFQVTCVPGGATRLTESPIAKCAFTQFSLGLAVSSAPKNADHPPALRSLKPSNASKDAFEAAVSGPVSHLVAGGWVKCEISANYHNRRLVAWEPAIEPWILDARLGVDLMQLLHMKPLKYVDVPPWSALSEINTPQSFSGIIPDVLNERAGEKIRDIGRLLRSHFKSGLPTQQFTEDSLRTAVETHSDLCYLILASAEPTLIGSALYPTVRTTNHSISTKTFSQQRKLSLLPGHSVMEWLEQFGYPTPSVRGGRKAVPQPSVVVAVSDAKTLNVNLTGALIENVLGYSGEENESGPKSRPLAPHWIRNDSGMKIRFREVLDSERARKGEKARKTILSSGCEIPLSLKRAVSQSCDPHRGHIWLEVGGFEDTVGRLYDQEYNIPKGSLSTSFRYKAVGKIPVDTVGVYQFSLSRNNENGDANSSGSMGWVTVRVELCGGIKVVSIESPLVLKNIADSDLLIEVRDRGIGFPLIWRALIPKSSIHKEGVGATKSDGSYVPVPVDIIPSVNDESAIFSVTALPRDSAVNHETELSDAVQSLAARVSAPPPYSQKSIRKGVISSSDISLEPISAFARPKLYPTSPDFVHLNVCSVRIGRISLDGSTQNVDQSQSGAKTAPGVPEQRMLLFRPSIVLKNHLPFAIMVQVRVGSATVGRRKSTSAMVSGMPLMVDEAVEARPDPGLLIMNDWENLGVLLCGKSISWTGAVASAKVEVRVRICEKDGQQSREFPSWSTSVVIPSRSAMEVNSKTGVSESNKTTKLVVDDAFGVPLSLSLGLEDAGDIDSAPQESIRAFARRLPEASRVVGIFVPFWIVNGTGRDLEFVANKHVAGQLSLEAAMRARHHPQSAVTAAEYRLRKQRGGVLGLAELLEDEHLLHLRARPSFEVLMIGDEKSNRLSVRKRKLRLVGGDPLDVPWSDPIALQVSDNYRQDVAVFPPSAFLPGPAGKMADVVEPFAFRTRILSAPERFGGRHGTKLIHLFNRYAIVNELGREIEILPDHKLATPVCIGGDGQPTPYHFDDSHRIRIRPREFGWGWSGPFSLTKKRREVLLRVRHKLKGHVIIVNVEFHAGQNSSTNVLVLRTATHPPFRLENHTMHPLQFGQSSTFTMDDNSLDRMLLPYHNVDFAWDEPDERRRSVVVCLADFAHSSNPLHARSGNLLGSVSLDHIAPGTELNFLNPMFSGQVVADGPTRVLRITDSSLPQLPSGEFEGADQSNSIFKKPDILPQSHQWIDVKLSCGIGISVVDWTPQELLYIRLDDITMERSVTAGKEDISVAVGGVTVDNQLWVTPYPVLMKMGHSPKDKQNVTLGLVEKRRKRKHNAIALSWCRAMNSHGGHGDLTLLNKFDLSTDPLILNVDGVLSDLIWTMGQQAAGIRTDSNENSYEITSRDAELRKVLGIFDIRDIMPRDKRAEDTAGKKGIIEEFGSLSSDFLATAAMAAKLRARTQTTEKNKSYGVISKKQNITEETKEYDGSAASLSKARRKYYIEKLKISTMKAEISWSGSLPAALFSVFGLVRPALTFEGLPIMLRQYTKSHAYGTTEDLALMARRHYISIWRLLDILVGLTFKPTFMVRACVFTSREGVATFFDWLSHSLSNVGGRVLRLSQDVAQPNLLHEDGRQLPKRASLVVNHLLYGVLVARTAKLTSSFLLGTAGVASMVTSSFRYSGSGGSWGRRSTSRSLRSRNPRLFANIDGKDLLVEYVEGENAGNAILSRVRMGAHLGEGYLFHMEGVGVPTRKRRHDSVSAPLILMLTSDRVLLLNGDRFVNFCAVMWEATFDDVVCFELCESEDDSRDLIKFWYLVDPERSLGNSDERNKRYASALVGAADSGLDLLRSKYIYVPLGGGEILRDKIAITHQNLVQ